MASIKEEAIAHEQKQTKNIADLEKVDVNMNIEDREGVSSEKDAQGNPKIFKYKVVIVEGEEYRIPGKVLGDLKAILEKNPNLTTFNVVKQGTGMNTAYTVVPL